VSRANSRGWACTSGSKRYRRYQDKANRPGQRTGRKGGEKVKSNYQIDLPRITILSAKVKYISLENEAQVKSQNRSIVMK